MNNENNKREGWGSNLGFILAAAGSAVGLGNIWKFPYIAGENGGGAFVLVYLACILIIGIPVMLCEITLGRHSQCDPVGTYKKLEPTNPKSSIITGCFCLLFGLFLLFAHNTVGSILLLILAISFFKLRWITVGALGIVAGFIILAFYSVVAGWTLGYIVEAVSNHLTADTTTAAKTHFELLSGNKIWAVSYHFLFMGLCVTIVCQGIKGGIERYSKILMPLLVVILVALMIKGLTLPGAKKGVEFFLKPDFSKLTIEGVLTALGHAFFTLSLGMGAIITYGSYVSKKQNLFTAALSIVILDTVIAILAGLAIFPAVFAMNMDPAKGPGLVFHILPVIFQQMPAGIIWASLFFLLLAVAALTSGISLLEVITTYFVDEYKWSRTKATCIFGFVIFLLGCVCIFYANFFNLLDNLSANWMLPIGGLFTAIFVGWVWGKQKTMNEMFLGVKGLSEQQKQIIGNIWHITICYITPVAVVITFLHSCKLIELIIKLTK